MPHRSFLILLLLNYLTIRHSVAIIYLLSFFVLRKRITVYQICTVSFARYGRMALFCFLLLSSSKKHKSHGTGGHCPSFYNSILALRVTMHSEIYCLWVHFYIDRSRKVPPTFVLGEPLAFRYYIKISYKECESLCESCLSD